jgi:hypothetical protein
MCRGLVQGYTSLALVVLATRLLTYAAASGPQLWVVFSPWRLAELGLSCCPCSSQYPFSVAAAVKGACWSERLFMSSSALRLLPGMLSEDE